MRYSNRIITILLPVSYLDMLYCEPMLFETLPVGRQPALSLLKLSYCDMRKVHVTHIESLRS